MNPRYLNTADNRLYRLSNFVVKEHEDAGSGSGPAAMYRCHECFRIFSLPGNLRHHLVRHKHEEEEEQIGATINCPVISTTASPSTEMIIDKKMPPLIEHLPREDFEDARPPRPRKKVLNKKRRQTVTGPATSLKRLKHKSFTQQRRRRHGSQIVSTGDLKQNRPPRRQASLRRLAVVECDSSDEVSDEFNSNSENEGDLSNRSRFWRPQRECKARTKTLVAISLAEQDYEKFDLDFAKFKTDVTSQMGTSPFGTAGSRLEESGTKLLQATDISSRLEAAIEQAAAASATSSPELKKAGYQQQVAEATTGDVLPKKKAAKRLSNTTNYKVKKGEIQ